MSLYCISKDEIKELCKAIFPKRVDHLYLENIIKIRSRGVITNKEYEFVTHNHEHWSFFHEKKRDELDKAMGWDGYDWRDVMIDDTSNSCLECNEREQNKNDAEHDTSNSSDEHESKMCLVCDLPVCERKEHQLFEGDRTFSSEWDCPEINYARKTATCRNCKKSVYHGHFHYRSERKDGYNKKYICGHVWSYESNDS